MFLCAGLDVYVLDMDNNIEKAEGDTTQYIM
jgi:hypothetical protein